ncbi:hypothetical protein N431DRAFT_406034 [Stipitochalara longipes BDJ]|nr:hypothetical protein N431DRAFT_406034 [Stipitochalara longipes BDJ]
MRQALVERIMDEFYLIFNQNWAARITKCPGGCSPTSGDGKDCGIPLDKVSLPTSQQKRQRSYDEDSADENDNKKPRRQRVGLRLPSELNNPARFACPFRKHDPQKYSMYGHRVCALTGWDTIARVKEHLYRNHKAAPYCQRCWVVFKTEELLNSHATVPAALICEASPGHPPEGITPKQVADLRSKAKPYSKQNEADRWKEIFRLLFPNESVPSPYWEPVQEYVPASPNSQVLVHYDDYMHRELPRLFRSRVEEIVSQEIQPVEASLLANLEGLIRECQYQLSSGYRETHLTGQQSRVLPTQRIETLVEPVNLTNTAEHSPMVAAETHQQPSSDFFDAVLQPPPPQEQDFVLNFSASDAELFGPNQHTPSGNLSDSGYASVSHCSCKEPCRCFTSMIGFENRDIDISGPSFVNLTQGMDMDAQGVQWQNWLENRD